MSRAVDDFMGFFFFPLFLRDALAAVPLFSVYHCPRTCLSIILSNIIVSLLHGLGRGRLRDAGGVISSTPLSENGG